MAEKNMFYGDFSNRKPFNNASYSSGEELVPVVLNEDMRATLETAGLDLNNVENWKSPYSKELVPIAFVPEKKENMAQYMEWFNMEVKRYLNHNPDPEADVLSLDALWDEINSENDEDFDTAGTTENEDTAFLALTFRMFLDDLSRQDETMGKIIGLLAEGYQKNEIIHKLRLTKGKTQAYAYIKKVQKLARQLFDETYR